MALDINIRITSDGEGTYSAHEQSILSALAAHPSQGAAAEWPPADRKEAPVEVSVAVTPKAAAAPKAAPATRAPKAAAAPKKPTPEPDVPMALDDTEAEAPAAPEEAPAAPAVAPSERLTHAAGIKLTQPVERTLDGAVTVVTELVGKGKVAPAKSALEAAGVKKVSAMETDEQVATFFATLEGN